jgi:hypothetical protein
MMVKWDINGNSNPNWYTAWCFGTMEFSYDFPFSWEWKIIPTDEVHHFSKG